MKKKLLPFALILLLLSGCNPAADETPPTPVSPTQGIMQESPDPATPADSTLSPSPDPDTTAHLDVTTPDSPAPSPAPKTEQIDSKPVILPLPSGKMFGLEGIDALLYDEAVANYAAGGLPTDLFLPSLAVLDTYETEDGNTCYVCWLEEHEYYGLGCGLGDLDNPEYTYCSPGRNLFRFTVSEDGDGLPVCIEILQSLNGDNWSWQKSVIAICGPNEELARAITEFKKPTVEARYITLSDPTDLLAAYLDYCFKTPHESPLCVKLPLPSSRMFGLEGVDAALYDGAVEYYSTRLIRGGKCDGLLLPSLALLDTYPADDGSTCYICMFRQYDYYDLGYGLSDLNNPQYNPGGGSNVARFTVRETEVGDAVCTDVFEGYDGPGWAFGVREICGPNEKLAEAIIGNTPLPVEKRDITPPGIKELLDVYLDYYFR